MKDRSYIFFPLTLLVVVMSSVGHSESSFPRCPNYQGGVKRVFWGDLHVHTSFSFDAYGYGTRNGPTEAYQFGKGQLLTLANGDRIRIDRPLDFMAVTDHSEFFDVMNLCLDPGLSRSPFCGQVKNDVISVATGAILQALATQFQHQPTYPLLCKHGDPKCRAAEMDDWKRVQSAAESAYDRCSFTTFKGYEWTGFPQAINPLMSYPQIANGIISGAMDDIFDTLMNHRNVIFGGSSVPSIPFDAFSFPKPADLWQALDSKCLASSGCDVLAIPHNSNASGGIAFQLETDRTLLGLRAKYERLVEIIQTKGNSECLNPNADDVSSEDCNFELMYVNQQVPWAIQKQSYVRTALEKGIRHYALSLPGEKLNPLQLGFVGSTDTHTATPGNVNPDGWQGSHGAADDDPNERLEKYQSLNPGGLTAVWAEENTRESLFGAMKRRETYATSGPRMLVNFYQTWAAPSVLCSSSRPSDAVPMGGTMGTGTGKPSFVVTASMDQAPLARVDIIRASIVNGRVVEKRLSFPASDRRNGEPVMCRVFQDNEYIQGEPAFWYARVLEVPTPRWSKILCTQMGNCHLYPQAATDVQQRAWTSPIWNLP